MNEADEALFRRLNQACDERDGEIAARDEVIESQRWLIRAALSASVLMFLMCLSVAFKPRTDATEWLRETFAPTPSPTPWWTAPAASGQLLIGTGITVMPVSRGGSEVGSFTLAGPGAGSVTFGTWCEAPLAEVSSASK
jgi:hypothetical protein